MADAAVTASIKAARSRRLEDEIGTALPTDDKAEKGELFASSKLDPARSMSITRLVSVKKNIYASAVGDDGPGAGAGSDTSATATAAGVAKSSTKGGASCGGSFTNSEIFALAISTPGPLVLIGFAFAYWYDCAPIPSLAYNVALAGVFELALAICAFAWHVERLRKDDDAARQNDGYLSSPALVVHDFLGFLVVGVAIWGAVLTFGRWDVMGMEEGQCNSALYLGAFISSVITILFVLYEMGESCWETFAEKDEE